MAETVSAPVGSSYVTDAVDSSALIPISPPDFIRLVYAGLAAQLPRLAPQIAQVAGSRFAVPEAGLSRDAIAAILHLTDLSPLVPRVFEENPRLSAFPKGESSSSRPGPSRRPTGTILLRRTACSTLLSESGAFSALTKLWIGQDATPEQLARARGR